MKPRRSLPCRNMKRGKRCDFYGQKLAETGCNDGGVRVGNKNLCGTTVDGSEILNNHLGCIKTLQIMGWTTNLNWWVNPGFLVAINSIKVGGIDFGKALDLHTCLLVVFLWLLKSDFNVYGVDHQISFAGICLRSPFFENLETKAAESIPAPSKSVPIEG